MDDAPAATLAAETADDELNNGTAAAEIDELWFNADEPAAAPSSSSPLAAADEEDDFLSFLGDESGTSATPSSEDEVPTLDDPSEETAPPAMPADAAAEVDIEDLWSEDEQAPQSLADTSMLSPESTSPAELPLEDAGEEDLFGDLGVEESTVDFDAPTVAFDAPTVDLPSASPEDWMTGADSPEEPGLTQPVADSTDDWGVDFDTPAPIESAGAAAIEWDDEPQDLLDDELILDAEIIEEDEVGGVDVGQADLGQGDAGQADAGQPPEAGPLGRRLPCPHRHRPTGSKPRPGARRYPMLAANSRTNSVSPPWLAMSKCFRRWTPNRKSWRTGKNQSTWSRTMRCLPKIHQLPQPCRKIRRPRASFCVPLNCPLSNFNRQPAQLRN